MSNSHPESQLQKGIMDLLAIYEKQGRLLAWPCPNGMHIAGKDRAERGRKVAVLKRMGLLRAGVLDIAVLMKSGQLVFLECKVGKNTMTDEQTAFAAKAELMGAMVYEVRSVGDAAEAIAQAECRRAA